MWFHPGETGLRGCWLVTGATGLVGQYLLRDMLRLGLPVAVLVRPTRQASELQRVESIMQRWERLAGVDLPRPVILSGDVTQQRLGLDDRTFAWVRDRVSHVLHNAAVLKFFGPSRDAEPWSTNVGGTRHVLELMAEAEIPDLHFVSTAYVSGRANQPVMEDSFPTSPVFRNDYEHSKWVAEGLVREAALIKPPTIYRPVVISGDSETGFTSTYHGLYLYLRAMAMLVPEQERDADGKILTPIRLPMRGDHPRNIVPVEWVSQVLTHLLTIPQAHGKTFHLAPRCGITPNQLIQYCYDYFGSTGVEFCPDVTQSTNHSNDFAAKMFDAMQVYQDYDNSDPVFDTTNLLKYAGHLDCPDLTGDVIKRYLDFGREDRWGKVKHPYPCVQEDGFSCVQRLAEEIGDLLTQLGTLENSLDLPGDRPEVAQRISFNLLGTGGGAWTIEVNPQGATRVGLGLAPQPTLLMQMSVRSLQQWLEADYVQRRATTARWLQRNQASEGRPCLIMNESGIPRQL
jgi:thioester reductase-like protein